MVNMYISRGNGVEERGADTGWRARDDDIIVDVRLFIVLCLYIGKVRQGNNNNKKKIFFFFCTAK